MSKKQKKHEMKLKPIDACDHFECEALGCHKKAVHMHMMPDPEDHTEEVRRYFCDSHFVRASQERRNRLPAYA